MTRLLILIVGILWASLLLISWSGSAELVPVADSGISAPQR